MKFLIIGDLHGRKPKIHVKNFDAIIVPGDICSDKGFRPATKQWMRELKKRSVSYSDFLEEKLGKRKILQLERESLRVGRSILEYLNSFGKPVYFIPGNWDQSYGPTRIKDMDKSGYHYYKAFLDFWLGKHSNPKLVRGLKHVYDCQFQSYVTDHYNIFGYGLSSAPENPQKLRKFRKKSKLTSAQYAMLKKQYAKIHQRLRKLHNKRNKKTPTLFLSHNVPYNTPLDKIIDKSSVAHGKHCGSTVAREFCEKYQPLVCVGGHVHEHFRKCKIGKTTVINAGFGAKVNVLLEIKGNKIKQLKFYGKTAV